MILNCELDNANIIVKKTPEGVYPDIRTFTLESFKILVTSFLIYYKEGYTDFDLDLGYTMEYEKLNTAFPDGFTEEMRIYWPWRSILYKFAIDNSLFPITLQNHTAEEVNQDEFYTKAKTLIDANTKKDELYVCFNGWKEIIKVLKTVNFDNTEEREKIASMVIQYCPEKLLCCYIKKIAAEEYGVKEPSEACKLCPMMKTCLNGAISNILKLVRIISSGTSVELNKIAQDIIKEEQNTDDIIIDVIENI